jgi:hypothetical protein
MECWIASKESVNIYHMQLLVMYTGISSSMLLHDLPSVSFMKRSTSTVTAFSNIKNRKNAITVFSFIICKENSVSLLMCMRQLRLKFNETLP